MFYIASPVVLLYWHPCCTPEEVFSKGTANKIVVNSDFLPGVRLLLGCLLVVQHEVLFFLCFCRLTKSY